MSDSFPLITTDLESHFQSLRKTGTVGPESTPSSDSGPIIKPSGLAGSEVPYEYPAPVGASGGFGAHHNKKWVTASNNVSFGQPAFFSPVYTPINWQIPSKRREIYQWCRFFYENEPRVAAAIDFYARFPLSTGFDLECDDRRVRNYYESLCDRLDILRWFRLMNHEVHLLGDCFPFLEVDCPHCNGSGWVGTQACEHEGGQFKRIVILNPDFVEVFTNPMSPENAITLIPDDELKDLVRKGGPGAEKLSAEVRNMVMGGQPIPLDNLSVSHLKYGESGYRRYGVSMIRRLFPILSYKTKLMTAQWIVAERMILPIKIVKVGTEERPASPQDIANVQQQLTSTSNDPNLVIVTHHAFDLNWVGAGSQVLQLGQEWENINDEILAGLGVNKALLNAEGPVYSAAAIGAEVMIQRLDSWRKELASWAEHNIFIPIAKMRGFVRENEWGENEYIIPKIRWNALNLRDVNQERQNILTLFDKGLISRRRVLEEYDIDADTEAEQIRYERIEAVSEMGPEAMGGGLEGGMGGGLDLGGGLSPGMGGDLGGDMGGGLDMGGAGGPDMGGMGGGDMGIAASTSVDSVNISNYGGKVMKEKSRRKHDSVSNRQAPQQQQGGQGGQGADGFQRDDKGRIWKTSLEIAIEKGLQERVRAGQIRHKWVPGLEVKHGPRPYLMDIAFPTLKVDVEADGEMYHSSEKDIERDRKRDTILRNMGWTVIRFKERDIKEQIGKVLDRIQKELDRKAALIMEMSKGKGGDSK